MLARRLASHASRVSAKVSSKRPKLMAGQRRSLSCTSMNQSSSASLSVPVGAIQSITDELEKIAPRIDIAATDIEVLKEPKDFYRTLKDKISKAKERIFLATLYIGRSEAELVQCIRQALKNNPRLTVSILTDALRGTRESPGPSCASLLASLAAEFPLQVEIRMYHTPNLTGIRKLIVPTRLNEGWGLQHMKLYGVDDEIILSGANLSNDYFTNRQDRYHVFSSKQLTDHFAQLHEVMCQISFLLRPGETVGSYSLIWPQDNPCPSPLINPRSFISASRELLEPLSRPNKENLPPAPANFASVFPTLIIPQAVNTELPAIRATLDVSHTKLASCTFTAGYFNPDPAIKKALLESARYHDATTIITASPWANGFYGSKGVSGMLPAAYTLLARQFLHSANRIAPGLIELKEWRLGTVGRPHGWTYHAKGIWLSYQDQHGERERDQDRRRSRHHGAIHNARSGDENPSVSVIGSSNYTVRSYSLDTEAGVVIVTQDPSLRQKFQLEVQNLLEHSKTVSERDLIGGERKVGPVVRIAMWIVRAIGGSL